VFRQATGYRGRNVLRSYSDIRFKTDINRLPTTWPHFPHINKSKAGGGDRNPILRPLTVTNTYRSILAMQTLRKENHELDERDRVFDTRTLGEANQ